MSNRLYRLRVASSSYWCIASSPEEAATIAVQINAAPALKDIKSLVDQTEQYLTQRGGESLRTLLSIPAARGEAVAFMLTNPDFKEMIKLSPSQIKIEWQILSPGGKKLRTQDYLLSAAA